MSRMVLRMLLAFSLLGVTRFSSISEDLDVASEYGSVQDVVFQLFGDFSEILLEEDGNLTVEVLFVLLEIESFLLRPGKKVYVARLKCPQRKVSFW